MNFFKMVIPFFKLILCSYYCGYNIFCIKYFLSCVGNILHICGVIIKNRKFSIHVVFVYMCLIVS